ncbi:hypothetical protein LXL04_012589 [Taraxacum kok-saghyz]
MLELLLFAVKDLRKSLKDVGSDMMIMSRRTESVIHDLVKEVITLRSPLRPRTEKDVHKKKHDTRYPLHTVNLHNKRVYINSHLSSILFLSAISLIFNKLISIKEPLDPMRRFQRRKEAQRIQESNESSTPVFINHAAIAWNEGRRQWIGDQSQKSQRMPKDPVISWSATYEDLLSTTNRFSEPIPLPEMVDFLVDIWHNEGLFD